MLQDQVGWRTDVGHLIPSATVARYTAAPADSTVAAAKSLQENIRDVLGSGYETYLQGSYKNDTGIPDLNDVDVVALRKTTQSGVFSGVVAPFPIPWEQIFQEVQIALEASHYYRGKTQRGDKCVKVDTVFHADVIPAVCIGDAATDPIAVYSFREQSERLNFPRVHYANNVAKQARTNDSYKPIVRMFKRWVRSWFGATDTAPSFYVECLVHSVPDERFMVDPVLAFVLVGDYIVNEINRYSEIRSIAGDKGILTSAEWDPAKFEVFQSQLAMCMQLVVRALTAKASHEAGLYWRQAFNE